MKGGAESKMAASSPYLRHGEHRVLLRHHVWRDISPDGDGGCEAAGGAQGGEGGPVVPRGGEDSHPPLANRRGEGVGHSAFVVLRGEKRWREGDKVGAGSFLRVRVDGALLLRNRTGAA